MYNSNINALIKIILSTIMPLSTQMVQVCTYVTSVMKKPTLIKKIMYIFLLDNSILSNKLCLSNLFLFRLPQSQFGLIILYLWLLYHNDCDVSQPFNLIWIINVCVIAGFFVNFYIRTYVLTPRKLTTCHSNKEKSTWSLSYFSSYIFI